MTRQNEQPERKLRDYLEDEDQGEFEERLEEAEQGQVRRPPRTDPRHTDDSVPPGQADVPRGGSTGEYMGGSAKRRKRDAG